MPITFADLDTPPRSRTRDLLIGVLIGAPVVALLAWLALPTLVGLVISGSGEFDERLRQEDAYMQTLCALGMDVERDGALCGCVLQVEVPALDCRDPFLAWSLARHAEACQDPATHKQALSFCSCIEVIDEQVAAAGDDKDAARQEARKVANCLELPDGFSLPPLTDLGVPGEALE